MIFNYKLYIFDLDGTIIDSEYSHYTAYNNQLLNKITYNEYQHIFHDEKKKKIFIKDNNICKTKKEQDFLDIYDKQSKLIEGCDLFLNKLIEIGKDIIIVTNSSNKRVSYILSKHPILKKVTKIITKDDMKKSKPDPECYINVINNSKYNIDEIIVFEDSYTGYKSLEFINIEKVFICDNQYHYYNNINYIKYKNYINIDKIFKPNFNIQLKTTFIKYTDNYSNCINENKENLFKIHNLLKCILQTTKKNLYFIGVGKSNLIAKKNAATWRSLGICVHELVSEDIWHGGFGIFNEESLIIYLSNSGNTTELIDIAKHINTHFNSTQIALTCNANNTIHNYVDYTFNLIDNLKENGNIQKAPTISSFIFMSFLDTLGLILTDDNITTSQFIKYHPGGALGKCNKIDYVIISCCGKGTRLLPITSHIPKPLVNIGNDNILISQIKYWTNYTDNFIIIIETKYNEIIDFYLKKYNINYCIKNVEINNNEENAYTLQKAIDTTDELINKRVIITWCDILIKDKILFNDFNDNIIFTFGNESRYYCEQNKIYKRENGNVIGCFYINKMKRIINDNNKNDICDIFLDNFKSFNTYELLDIIDVGDMNKLDNYFNNIHNNKYKTRFFNTMEEIDDNKLKKNSIDKYGIKLIQTEIKYYKYILDLDLPFPKLFDTGNNCFIMEKKCNFKNIDNINIDEYILKKIFKKLNVIHSKIKEIDNETYYNDIKNEFNDKIINRINEINQIINYITPTKINNIDVYNNIHLIITDLYNKIISKLNNRKKEYCLIHGDCQFSNILYNNDTNEICFIDPRGYFGNTLFFGIKEYDYSKLLYALSGYDNFNNDNKYCFVYDNTNNNLNTNIDYYNILKYKHIFQENDIDFELCLYMVIIHWFGLSSYNNNNIHKCISSYYQGIFLYYKFVV
jgi:HAD superfamily hydrolase (TIGR01509 family)